MYLNFGGILHHIFFFVVIYQQNKSDAYSQSLNIFTALVSEEREEARSSVISLRRAAQGNRARTQEGRERTCCFVIWGKTDPERVCVMFCRKVLEQRDLVYEKISQYLQLKNTIQSLQVHTHTHTRKEN